jgi:high affinity Mn2+ porin
MGWGVMYNGAWDYPADTRGYTWGWLHELHMKRFSLCYGSTAMPHEANGLRFDGRLFRDRADVFEGELRYSPHRHDGALRLLSYQNQPGVCLSVNKKAPDSRKRIRRLEVQFAWLLEAEANR